MITRTCQHCGKTYETFPSIRLQFCGSRCANLAKTTRVKFNCATCGKECWHHAGKVRKYCSRSCAMTARNLTDKNPSYNRDISGENNPMYGKEGLSGEKNPMYGKKGELNPRWKGGRKVRKDGYVLVIAPDDHPSPAYLHSGRKYILEHRLVMEQHLGRYLEQSEVIHHINENPSDNRIENLQLFATQAEHARIAHGKNSTHQKRQKLPK